MAKKSTTIGKDAGPSLSRVDLPLSPPQPHDAIVVGSHTQLLAMARPLAARLRDDPAFSVMLLANPVLALRDYGIRLSPEMEHHVLTTLRHPPKLRARRAELEASLERALGTVARPTDPEWLAGLVFKTRAITPREIAGLEPVYRPPLNADALARLRAQRPAATTRYPGPRRIKVVFGMGVAPGRPALRRLDLDAALPELGAAPTAPATLTLEQAWFYKDDPIVHDAVELGTIVRRGFPFKTPAEYRALAEGRRADAFRTFVRAVGVRSAGP